MLIGLAGRAGSGKSTVARQLCEAHRFRGYAFAAPIKAMIADAFGLTLSQIEGPEKESPVAGLGRSPRYLMQTLGTEWGRDLVHQDVWVFCAERWLHETRKRYALHHRGQPLRVVISDVRFDNEAAWIRGQGGIVAHVVRDTGRSDSHASEAGIELADGDWRIDNSGTFGELRACVDDMIDSSFGWSYFDALA